MNSDLAMHGYASTSPAEIFMNGGILVQSSIFSLPRQDRAKALTLNKLPAGLRLLRATDSIVRLVNGRPLERPHQAPRGLHAGA